MSDQYSVLVVDDSDSDREAAVNILKQSGYHVTAVTSGFEAMETLPTAKFDVVVTDIVMPRMGGYEVIQEVRRQFPDMVIIAMTSHGALESALDAINFGAYSYLTKPVDPLALQHALNRGLERRKLVLDLRERNESLTNLNRDLDLQVQKATKELRELNQGILNRLAGMQEIDRLKSSFLSNVSHDLKSPLTTILGYISYLQDCDGLAPEIKTCLNNTRVAVAHMEYLINQLVEATRLSAGKVELVKTEVPLQSLLEEALTLVRPQTQSGGQELSLDADAVKSLTLQADRGRLLQVLSNLLGNAVKFTPKGGKITLKAWPEKDLIHFAVTDTGVGIAPEHLERVFEKFYQVDTSLSRRTKGLGLGLRIAKELVELHGGKIWVESKVGVGSTFHFTLEGRRA